MRYLTLTKGKMADNGKFVQKSQKTMKDDDSTTTNPTCTKTLVVSLSNLSSAAITGTPSAAVQQKTTEDATTNNEVASVDILDETTGLLRALLAVGKETIIEDSLQSSTPPPAPETVKTTEKSITGEEISDVPVEEAADPRSSSEMERDELAVSDLVVCDSVVEEAEREPSETMEVELDPDTAPLAENDEDSASEESTLMNIKGLRIVELLHKDQLDGINSLADTHIVCEDGHVPFHRYILMAASRWMNELLMNEDPSELTVIHIPDVKVANVVQVLCILYSGKALYKKSDEANIYKIFQMLGVSTDGLQFRNSKPEDGTILGKLRFYEKELESEEEDFIPNIIQSDSPEIPVIEANVENEGDAVLNGNEIVQLQEVEEARGPKVVSKSQIDKAETAKFMSIKMEMSEDDDSIIQTDYRIKCRYCNLIYTSEESLSEHLSSSCGSHLVGKYSYVNKQCLGCRGRFPSYNLYGLINHVESCKRLEVAFSATASQFVNGNLPPVSVKQENVDQLDEMGNEIFPHGSKSIGKGSKNEEPKSKGRKRVKNRTKKRKHSGGKRKAAIHIVDVRELGEKEDVVETINGNGQQIEMEVTNEEQHIHQIEEEDDDVIFEEEIIHPPNSKKPRCEPPSSSAAGSSNAEVMHSGKPVVIQDFEEQEEIEYVIENDPSGCCKDISKVPVQDLRLLLTTCPVCKKRYIKMKTASKCLRTHGLRRCWICLKLVPSNGQDFLQHNLKHIIPGTEGKVLCSFCGKPFGYNIGINTHMGNYHFSRLLETTTEDLDNNKSLSAKQIKTLETLNRGLANEKVPKNSTPANRNEQSMNSSSSGEVVEEIVISEESEECETISSDGDDPDFVPTVRNLEFIDDIEQMPKTRNSLSAEQKRASIPSTVTSATKTSSPPTPPLVKPPNLGRVLLEMKEIDGQIYNIYGLINPTSTDPKNKFSKVIAIRNTDVKTSST